MVTVSMDYLKIAAKPVPKTGLVIYRFPFNYNKQLYENYPWMGGWESVKTVLRIGVTKTSKTFSFDRKILGSKKYL